MLGIRGTDSFIWSVADAIGNGVTGTVYKCREKKAGKPYAAKVLNSNSELRPYEVRVRETEVLKKLDHPNIVTLRAIEQEHGSRHTVIFMELCETSLFEILEEPQHTDGLNEQDYIDVIQDISSGMEYLRASNVVHRDVKPGNILRLEKESGKYTYKISDFGTARELGNTDQFMSYAYGTEEYLHPDLYERAVMKMSKSKTFNSTVDLWSLGVTFYHLATGELPFQPHGGRNNKEMMFRMITEKKPGVISCHQNPHNNQLIYSSTLPDKSQLSEGLKVLMTPVLRGLLETDPEYMISHDDFFKTITNIVERKPIDVYFTKMSTMHRLYMQQEDDFSHLQDVLVSKFEWNPSRQLLFHNFREFKPDPTTPILHYPEITTENPLIVDTHQYVPSIDIPVKKLAIVQETGRGSKDDEARLAKLYACLSYMVKRDIDNLLSIRKAIHKAHDTLEYDMDNIFKGVREYCINLKHDITDKCRHLYSNHSVLTKLQGTHNSEEENALLSDDDQHRYNAVVQLMSKLESEISDILDKKILKEEWFSTNNFLKMMPWNEVVTADIRTTMKIYNQFCEDRRRQSSNLDDLTHKYEKMRLSKCYTRLQEQHASLTEHRNKLHDQFVKWLILVNHRKEIMCSFKLQLLGEVKAFEEHYEKKHSDFEREVIKLLSVPSTCTHDFRKLEEGLAELDCMPDLLNLVHEQEEKLKMLQDLDAKEQLIM